jgi:SsrA-binding protein
MKNEKTKPQAVNIKNKRASFDYEFIDTYTAGIVLTGTEIKSIRLGKASLVDTYLCAANCG